MNIKFKQTNDTSIAILDADTNNQIGCIFTPSGTGRETPSAIQVCGFDRAFDHWGCGVFHDGKSNMKQDIQLLFNKNSISGHGSMTFNNECLKCYYRKDNCQCDKLRSFDKKELICEELEK
jgi:hypothetical protein